MLLHPMVHQLIDLHYVNRIALQNLKSPSIGQTGGIKHCLPTACHILSLESTQGCFQRPN